MVCLVNNTDIKGDYVTDVEMRDLPIVFLDLVKQLEGRLNQREVDQAI